MNADQATTSAEAQAKVAAATAASKAGGDDRLAYRGVFARLLVRPESGAAIAALAIWVFFWAVAEKFGLAGGASSILDVSATLGIMAVAVAMLMIGGEFDLSSGAATGTLAIITLLLVRDVTGSMGGAGFSLWVALPISLALALGLGWFNGTMVNKTGLPSFIVTLASFFILRGAKLGFAKRIVDQIQVGKMDDLGINAEARGGDRGYAFFNKIFAAEWDRNDHQFGSRDAIYTFAAVAGVALLVLAAYELNFLRRKDLNPTGLAAFAGGLVGGIVGITVLHQTDGSSGNILGAAIIGVSILGGLVGLGLWRYEARTDRLGVVFHQSAVMLSASGLAAIVVAILVALRLDAEATESIWFFFTEQGLRAMLFVGLSVLGLLLIGIAAHRSGEDSQGGRSVLSIMLGGLIAVLALFIRSESVAPKFRADFMSILLVIAALVATWAVCNYLFQERRTPDQHADRLGGGMALLGVLGLVVALVVRLLFTVQAEIDVGIPPAKFSVRILWFLLFTAVATWVLGRTKFGSWTFAVGGNKEAARQIGVPTARTKTQLFMIVSFAAWLVGTLLAFRLNTIQAGTGDGLEFEYIIAAVVGGTMLTGGYGSTFGAGIGAIIMAMSVQGIPSARWNSDWRFVFLGSILLSAVVANNFIRSKAEASR
jgi:ribose/xylose/arabinose/galactoside ABC-type transport system permease subunit